VGLVIAMVMLSTTAATTGCVSTGCVSTGTSSTCNFAAGSITILVPSMSGAFDYTLISEVGELTSGSYSGTGNLTIPTVTSLLYQIIIGNGALTTMFMGGTDTVTVNGYTTIATVFCLAQLVDATGTINDFTHRRLAVAYLMSTNFVDMNGHLGTVVATAPNGPQTNSLALFNSLTNLLLQANINPTTLSSLLALTPGATTPMAAFLYIAQNPFNNIASLFALTAGVTKVYTPALAAAAQVGQFSLSVKINTSGSLNYLPGGPARIVFDKRDRVWVSLNNIQGVDASGTFAMVLEPTGQPTSFSPIFPVLGGAYGIAYDIKKDQTIFGSYGWGALYNVYNPYAGAINVFDALNNAKLVSPSAGYTAGLNRVQGIALDSKGNYWMASWGSNLPMGANISVSAMPNSTIVVYLKGNPSNVVTYVIETGGDVPNSYYAPFSIAIDANDNVFVSLGGNGALLTGGDPRVTNSSVIKLTLNSKTNVITEVAAYNSGDFLFYRGLALNAAGEVYVASVTENTVYKFDNDLNPLYEYYSNNTGPWGVTVDTAGDLWVANFNAFLVTPATPGVVFGLSKLIDNGSSMTLYGKFQLPTGGSPVTLATGQTLFNSQNIAVKSPLMRLTHAAPDAAGNVYIANNWKPDIIEDVVLANPGGDGVIIFVGIGAPRDLTI